MIEMLNIQITPVYKEELLHITFHKPVVGDYRKDFSDLLEYLAKTYSNTRIVLSGLGIFDDNIVMRIQPTYHVALLWVTIRKIVEHFSGEKGDDDNMLHVTLFKKVPDIEKVQLFSLVNKIPLTGTEFSLEYVCLFEKIDEGPWVEIERLSLMGET